MKDALSVHWAYSRAVQPCRGRANLVRAGVSMRVPRRVEAISLQSVQCARLDVGWHEGGLVGGAVKYDVRRELDRVSW